jgi:serine/threonine protein kinase
MPLIPGSRLGPYEIVGAIGAGGMGEVYRARDTKLGRDVAIKILTASFAGDAERLKRFEQEARTAGALNHPNLVTVFDLGVAASTSSGQAGAPYIVMELVEGETLRHKLSAGAVPIRKAVDYAAQIASGLAAAHDRGIVHRDLKPENIIVTPEGRLKILDFGLAKTTAPHPAGESLQTGFLEGTSPGTVLGTVGYMAPEQVRGELAIDHRADLFALGAILYEMLSGRRAFAADSAVETMSAILRADPDLARSGINIPPGVARLVDRCLEKNPAERFQSARDLGFHLSALSSDSGHQSGALPAIGAPSTSLAARSERSRWIVMGAMTVAGAVAGFAIAWGLFREPAVEPVRFETFTYSGSDNSPSTSPDGRTIAFSSARNGRRQIWLKQIAGGGETARTQGPDDSSPRFSPDGASLLFLRVEQGQRNLYRTAVLGGEERRLLSEVDFADWSPDAGAIAFAGLSPQRYAVVGIVQADGSSRRDLHTVPDWVPWSLAWSPDGQWLLAAFVPEVGTTGAQVKLIPVGGGEPRELRNQTVVDLGSTAAWTGSGELIYSTSETGRVLRFAERGHRVVAHDLATDHVRTLFWTFAAPGVMDVVAPGTLAFDAISFSQNLRSVALRPSNKTSSTAGPGVLSGQAVDMWLTRGSSMDRQPAFSPDGSSIIFASNRSRNLDLWVLSRKDGSIRRLTDDASADWDPAYTFDGKHILWSSNRSGNFEIWMAAADGSGARQVSRDGVDAENPAMTPDGNWVLHWSSNPEKRGIWKLRPDGTDARLLLQGGFSAPEVSPDGQYFAVSTAPEGERRRIVLHRVDDGSVVPFSIRVDRNGTNEPNYGRLRWMPGGKAIAFVAAGLDGRTGIFVQDVVVGQDTTATRRQLAGFAADSQSESFGIAPDGSVIVISIAAVTSDVLLAHGIPNLLPPVRGKR